MPANDTCIFCTISNDRIIAQNNIAIAISDGYPVTNGHALIIPKRHAIDYFSLNPEEQASCNDLLRDVRELLLQADDSIDGFNIGMNCGEAAGQTIFHCHIHLIPRRAGDVDNPRGGIRHLIPGKGNY